MAIAPCGTIKKCGKPEGKPFTQPFNTLGLSINYVIADGEGEGGKGGDLTN